MVQNLDLDLKNNVTLTSANTDLNSKTTWTPQYSTQTTAGTTWAENGGDVARSMDPGNIYFPGGTGSGTAGRYENFQGATSGQPWEHIGNYYNWYAATAGSGIASMWNDGVNDVARDSICPKGWRLSPVMTGEYLIQDVYMLDNNDAGAAKALQFPLNHVRSGYYSYYDGNIYHQGYSGSWWSPIAGGSNANAFYIVNQNPNRLDPRFQNRKGFGLSIRCVCPT